METEIERVYWSDGQLRLEQPYVDGKRHGMMKWGHQNGDIDEFWLWNQNELVAKFNPRNETQKWKLK
jgi:hypothetical protein